MLTWVVIGIVALIVFAVVIARNNTSPTLPPPSDDDTWHVKPAPPKASPIFTDERNRPAPKSVPAGWTDSEEQRGQRWSKRNIWYETEIVGESNYQQNIESFCAGGSNVELTADLVLENDNAYDSKAVRVDIGGKVVGYLSRQDARTYRKMLASGSADQSYAALVRGTLGRRGIYLSLDMRNFERAR